MDDFSQLTFEERDEYLRQPVAKNIIKLLSAKIAISPMIIDGGWGTGKTEFCYKLINMIDEDTSTNPLFMPVYIDAFKADHADDPLMTVLAAILAKLPEDKAKSLVEKALPLLGFGLKTVGKGFFSWILKQDATEIVDDLDKVLEKAGSEALDSSVKALLDGHINADKNMKALSDALSELAKAQPMILFIDELDRCRPDFAVSMLETIKHVFDVRGVQFVLITNTDQLKASINHCYGSAVNAQRYLDKFIGYSFILPSTHQASSKKVQNSYQHFLNGIEKSLPLKESLLGVSHHFTIGFIKELIEINGLSLREVETFLKYLEVYHVLSKNNGIKPDIILGYAFMRIFSVFLYSLNKANILIGSNKKTSIDLTKKVVGKESIFTFAKRENSNIYASFPDERDLVLALVMSDLDETMNLSKEWGQYIMEQRFFQLGSSFGEEGFVLTIIEEVMSTLQLN